MIENIVNAQNKDTVFNMKNCVYFEIGGKGGLYSLNYERRFPIKSLFSIEASLGYSQYSILGHPIKAISPEIDLTYGKQYKAEIGYIELIDLNNKNSFTGILRLGIRYQKTNSRLLSRFNLCILSPHDNIKKWRFLPGFSIGYVF